jgi:hypothetical protein
MPRLSAIDAVSPALERMQSMLFRPFRLKIWLKIGFIAWLAGGASGSFNLNVPSFPGGKRGDSGGIGDAGKNMGQFLRSWARYAGTKNGLSQSAASNRAHVCVAPTPLCSARDS